MTCSGIYGIVDERLGIRDSPTMATVRADAKKRVVIPAAQPGGTFELRSQGEGRFLLVRLSAPQAAPTKTREECLASIAGNPLRLRLSWEELRRQTREP
jgi:hypothetical protein